MMRSRSAPGWGGWRARRASDVQGVRSIVAATRQRPILALSTLPRDRVGGHLGRGIASGQFFQSFRHQPTAVGLFGAPATVLGCRSDVIAFIPPSPKRLPRSPRVPATLRKRRGLAEVPRTATAATARTIAASNVLTPLRVFGNSDGCAARRTRAPVGVARARRTGMRTRRLRRKRPAARSVGPEKAPRGSRRRGTLLRSPDAARGREVRTTTSPRLLPPPHHDSSRHVRIPDHSVVPRRAGRAERQRRADPPAQASNCRNPLRHPRSPVTCRPVAPPPRRRPRAGPHRPTNRLPSRYTSLRRRRGVARPGGPTPSTYARR